MSVSPEIVQLAEDRLHFWNQLRELAGVYVSDAVKDMVTGSLEEQYEARLTALAQEYEQKMADLRTQYPRVVARRMAEGLLRLGNGNITVGELMGQAAAARGLEPIGADVLDTPGLFGPTDGGTVATPAAVARRQRPRPRPSRRPRRSTRSGRRRPGHGPVDRDGALHDVQRVHEPERQDVRLQRQQAGVHQGREGGHVRADGAGGGALPGRPDPPGDAAEPEGEGPGEVDRAGEAVQLMV
jgi:hypothetical protein